LPFTIKCSVIVGTIVSILSVVVYAVNTLYYSTTIDREFVYRNFTTPSSGSDSSSDLPPEWGLWMYKKKVIPTIFAVNAY
jgi:hypothetical protein